MADLAKSINQAKAKLEANDDNKATKGNGNGNGNGNEAALLLLLDVWRAKKHPRIANLIDRVSDHIRDARGPLKAKSVKDRTLQWVALANKKNPADVGTLLATPWPGTWKDAYPLLEPLKKFPADPRIAVALSRIVEEGRFDTWTSSRFYNPLLSIVEKTLDLRTLPILEVDLTRDRSGYWKRSTGKAVTRTIAALKKAYPKNEPPALTKTEDAALAAIESLFAGEMSAEQAHARGEADFLKAIYENPNDDAARAVYADWLTEKGDPRGEFITYQLAHNEGRSTEETRKKERTLLRKHNKTWIDGDLDRMLDKDHRIFRRGFFAEGQLTCRVRDDVLPKELSNPAWATATRLTLNWGIDHEAFPKLMAIPSMRFVKAFHDLSESTLTSMLEKDETIAFPTIEELGLSISHRDEDKPDEQRAQREKITSGKAFPNVKRLVLQSYEVENIGWIFEGALAKRLESISYEDADYPFGPLLRLIEKANLKPKEVTVRYRDDWRLTLRRDEQTGKLTKLTGAPAYLDAGDHKLPSAYHLLRALATLNENDLTEFTVERRSELTCNYGEDDLLSLEKEFARQKNLTKIEVPWIRLSAKSKPNAPTATNNQKNSTACIELSIIAVNPINARKLTKLMTLMSEPPLSLNMDAFAVNYGAHTPLDADKEKALAQLVKALEKKRTTALDIYETGNADCARVRIRRTGLNITAALPRAEDHVDLYRDLIEKTFEILGKIERASMPFVSGSKGVRYDLGSLMPFDDLLQWMWMLDPKVDKMLPFDSLLKLPKMKGLEWLRVERDPDGTTLHLFFCPSPDKVPDQEQTHAFEVACCELYWKTFAKRFGFVPHELFMKMFGAPLKKAGFALAPPDPKDHHAVIQASLGRRQFRRVHKKIGAQALMFEARHFLSKELLIQIEASKSKNPASDLLSFNDIDEAKDLRPKGGGFHFVKTEDQTKKFFDYAAKQLPELLEWFDTPSRTN